jgi:hypothetical protein
MKLLGFSVHLLGKAADRKDEIVSAPEARDEMGRTL